jgi:hypothetical protein
LIYGEIDFLSFISVLKKINLDPGGTFYDLGSGSGRAVFAVRPRLLLLDFAYATPAG